MVLKTSKLQFKKNVKTIFIESTKIVEPQGALPVPSLREGQRTVPPLTTACAPTFGLLKTES